MRYQVTKQVRHGGVGKRMLKGASVLALAAATATSTAIAQDADDEDVIVVRGIKNAIQSAQETKQNSDVFVDAISAEDIGALPDRSVSEALQRVPGVNVLRFAGPNDPDHFAVEGSGVIVRGLPFVRSELNGRDVFGASSNGALGFEDVSPELLGSVVVFKNQSADMVEGGLAGTVDLRTRLPFDARGMQGGFSVEGTYSDLAEELTPGYSGLFSNTFETDMGEFGFLVSGSHNELKSRADTVQVADWVSTTVDGQDVFIPRGGGIRTQDFDRSRTSFAAAAQWESPDDRFLATVQFLQSDSELMWGERVLESSIDDNPPVALVGDDFEFDDDGLLQRGTISETAGWRGNDNNLPLNGVRQLALARERSEEERTTDFGINLKFTPNDKWAFNFDAQYVDATTEVFDVTVHSAFFSQLGIDLTGDSGEISYIAPDGTNTDYFQSPDNYYLRSAMDHAQDSEAESVAFRADAEYDFDGDGWLKSARFGARYSDKDTLLRYSTFNWGNVSEIWTGNPLVLLSDDTLTGAGLIGGENFTDFQRGSSPITGVPFWSGPLSDYDAFVDAINPVLSSGNSFKVLLGDRDGVTPGTLFLPSEVGDVSEETTAFYGRLDFGFNDVIQPGWVLDGNVGIRYVETDITSAGSITIPSFSEAISADVTGACDASQGTPPGFCSEDIAQLQTFFGTTGDSVDREFENSYDFVLPSLNMKLDMGDGRLVRFGVSKSISRPEIFDLRTFLTVQGLQDIPAADGSNTFRGIGGDAGNPFLSPAEALSIDLSYEWYFAEAGSFTVGVFWKEIEGLPIGQIGDPGQTVNAAGSEIFELTNNGETLPVIINTRINSEETGSLTGFEIAYQQFYDTLPAPWDGLGVQANYTYIDAGGVSDLDFTETSRFPRDNGVFERVSEHQYNIAGLYEKGDHQARLAYNWRDDFLLTKRDVIFPFASIYQEATGQLDGSYFYTVDENWKIGVQAVNILNDITETTQTITDDGLRAPRSYNENDRRVSFVIRGSL